MIGMQKYIDNVFCIVLSYCFQIQRNSVRRFEKQSDLTVNYSSVSENKFKALDPTLTSKYILLNQNIKEYTLFPLILGPFDVWSFLFWAPLISGHAPPIRPVQVPANLFNEYLYIFIVHNNILNF